MAKLLKNTRENTRTWRQDPEAVKADILRAARAEFAEHGLSGARVQDIADRIETSKRMIFYYFTDKETLYRAVLEAAYRQVREGEKALDLAELPPDRALARLVEFTFDHHSNNPEFIRLVMIENIHHGRHLKEAVSLGDTNTSAIEQLEDICARGREAGLFRDDVSPLELHWQISAMSFFNVANRTTFALNFGDALFSAEGQASLRRRAVDSILRSILIKPETWSAN
ncbi:MAG: TetR family transcriptional regulator [Hyphomicrobiales bacterium]|nr:MAG: TetR family transcriptional regulator [Hyphomicrobiales bacterium]